MVASLPEELIDSVQQQILLRESQLQQLSLFYDIQHAKPQVLVAYGPVGTSKLETIRYVLQRQGIEHVTVDCKECLSQRHLLSKVFANCVKSLGKEEDVDKFDRLENINALASNLKKLLHLRHEPLVVIVAGADRQRGANAALFPALARLGDLIPCLSLILTSGSPRPLTLHKSGVPYVYFPPYKRNEAIQILLQDPPPLLPDPIPEFMQRVKEEKVRRIYSQFVTVLYDTLIAPTSNSILQYRQTCQKLWPRFIWPLLSGEIMPGKSATVDWDFTRLLGRNRVLFQGEGEAALQDRLVSNSAQPRTFAELISQKMEQDRTSSTNLESVPPLSAMSSTAPSSTKMGDLDTTEIHPESRSQKPRPLLKYFTTVLLLSAYLASHTHQKHDIVLFSRLSTASSTNRRKKKYLARSRAGGITKTPTKSPSAKTSQSNSKDKDDILETPTKKKTPGKELGMNGTETPKKERADRSMRAIFEKTSNVARPFTLERVVAIFRAIHPDGIKSERSIADRVYAELSELERLKLVVRSDPKAVAKGVDAEDIMEEKWKCIVGKAWVVEAGRFWGVGIEGWEVE